MRIRISDQSKKQEKGDLAIVLAKAALLEKHPFFGGLSVGEKSLLSGLVKKFPKDGLRRTVSLAGGRTVLFLVNSGSWNHRRSLLAARQVIDLARRERIGRFSLNLADFETEAGTSRSILAESLAVQFSLANFEFSKYKTLPIGEPFFVSEIIFPLATKESLEIEKGLQRGLIIGEETNNCRMLCNTPGGEMTPAVLAADAVKTGKRVGFKTSILGKKEIEKLKMGGLLGVANGSVEGPKFIVMEYWGGSKKEKPVVLVGKGITFDTGGLNVKTENYMNDMHMDMTGGAAVIHSLAALARLKTKKNFVGLVPAAENSVSSISYRPGDILKTMSGKTIEVLNTDAEGRIVLADALHYAKRYEPRLVIDVATLTGAAMRALGQRASAVFATDEKISQQLAVAGERIGDFVWPLPLWEDYEEEIKGTFGDVANLGKTNYGGAITAAVFLWQFIKGWSWIHLDIAPRMVAIDGEFLAKGSAGPAVALLAAFLKDF